MIHYQFLQYFHVVRISELRLRFPIFNLASQATGAMVFCSSGTQIREASKALSKRMDYCNGRCERRRATWPEAVGGEGDLRERIKAEACMAANSAILCPTTPRGHCCRHVIFNIDLARTPLKKEKAPSGASAGRIGDPLMG